MTQKIHKKKTLLPKLRFLEFKGDGEWSCNKLSLIAKPIKEKAAKLNPEDVLTLSGEHGLVRQTDYFGKKIARTDLKRYLRIEQNDFVYNDRTTTSAKYGSLKRLTNYPKGAVSPIYKCFRFGKEEKPVFWEHYFDAGAHEAELSEFVNEGARAGRFNISVDTFLSISVCYPDEAEQQKIADCLSSLDDLLTAHSAKLNVLQDHKEGLLQQLFPAKGLTTPFLRFTEFWNKPEWQSKRLKILAKRSTQRNNAGKNKRVMTNSANFGVVDQRDYFSKDIANKDNLGSYFIVQHGDYVYNPRISNIAPVGPISRNNIGIGVMSPLYTIFRFKTTDTDFFAHYFKSAHWHEYLRNVSNSGARHDRISITTTNFMEMPIPLPLSEEQQKIADCLSTLDDLITAQTKQVAALKEYKKGLMQQLFPNPELSK